MTTSQDGSNSWGSPAHSTCSVFLSPPAPSAALTEMWGSWRLTPPSCSERCPHRWYRLPQASGEWALRGTLPPACSQLGLERLPDSMTKESPASLSHGYGLRCCRESSSLRKMLSDKKTSLHFSVEEESWNVRFSWTCTMCKTGKKNPTHLEEGKTKRWQEHGFSTSVGCWISRPSSPPILVLLVMGDQMFFKINIVSDLSQGFLLHVVKSILISLLMWKIQI